MSKTWLESKQLQVTPPKKPLKITGTRFAAIRGLNRWSSEFQAWCEITRTYKPPFEDTIYTIAGKTIEPHQADWLQDTMGLGKHLVRPEDIYGAEPFKKTFGDFYPNEKVLGGMWDYLIVDDEGKPTTVIECKTTKRAEDWAEDIPEYYAEQAALYAYLLGVENVVMLCTFLQPDDYDHPADVVIDSSNTILREFKMSERYPHFQDWIEEIYTWYDDHVITGLSPHYDEATDYEYLKALRTAIPTANNLADLTREAEQLESEIEELVGAKEKRLKALKDSIKKELQSAMSDCDEYAEFKSDNQVWTLSKTNRTTVDKKKLEADGLLEHYSKTSTSTRLTKKEI